MKLLLDLRDHEVRFRVTDDHGQVIAEATVDENYIRSVLATETLQIQLSPLPEPTPVGVPLDGD